MEPEEEREEDAVKVDTVDRAAGELGDIVDLAIIVIIFFISCVTVVGVCVIVILAGYKVGVCVMQCFTYSPSPKRLFNHDKLNYLLRRKEEKNRKKILLFR